MEEYTYPSEHKTGSENQSLRTLLTVSILISAIVGSVFGYYGASVRDGSLGSKITGSILSDTEESDRVISIVKKASPAVVSIVATKDLQVIEEQYQTRFPGLCDDPFFRDFFLCDPQPGQRGMQRQEVASGSGFIIRADGLILTNRHVIDVVDADFTVLTNDGKKHKATVLAKDPVQDLALLKISGTGFPVLAMGNSDEMSVGQTVLAIGNALGEFSNSVSKGIVSGLSRSVIARAGITSERLEEVIQTDAAINPGNSGGPLLNLNGEVVGINTAIVSGAQNVGFAIPINNAKRDIQDVERLGRIVYPYLGIRYIAIDDTLQTERNLPVDYGALVIPGQAGAAVDPESPAARAGIKENDIILEINGKKITFEYTIAQAVQSAKVGDTIRLLVLRGQDRLTISATLEERK